jgi:hypothetical protein
MVRREVVAPTPTTQTMATTWLDVSCDVNFVMHCYLDSNINVYDARLFAPEAMSFLIFLKNKNV